MTTADGRGGPGSNQHARKPPQAPRDPASFGHPIWPSDPLAAAAVADDPLADRNIPIRPDHVAHAGHNAVGGLPVEPDGSAAEPFRIAQTYDNHGRVVTVGLYDGATPGNVGAVVTVDGRTAWSGQVGVPAGELEDGPNTIGAAATFAMDETDDLAIGYASDLFKQQHDGIAWDGVSLSNWSDLRDDLERHDLTGSVPSDVFARRAAQHMGGMRGREHEDDQMRRFVDTGAIDDPDHLARHATETSDTQMSGFGNFYDNTDKAVTAAFADYVRAAGPRPPVNGWESLR